MDYKQVAVYKERRLLEKVDRLKVLLYNCIVAFEEEQTFDTKDTMLKYLGMSEKEYKEIMGE